MSIPYHGWVPSATGRGTGVLGPRPHVFLAQNQTLGAPSGTLVPTDIAATMQTMSLQQPDDNWYMDTGASSHMTSNAGTLSSYFNLSTNNKVIVGNGTEIPILGCRVKQLQPPLPPLLLNNVLHAPHIIKNLVSVRKFTSDNNVSVDFDRFGFIIKDMQTGKPLMRRNSLGELYPLLPTHQTQTSAPQALTTVSASTWHNRLGHPGPAIVSVLRNNNFISCRSVSTKFCHSC